MIKFSGVFQPADGQPPASVEVVTLSIYAEQEGGVALWQEIQTVVVDTTGRFTVLLGASHPDGLPLEVFASGEARWMSLEFARAGEVERSRVRITSVPYALKAEDAETLGGRPASAYLLAPTEGRQGTPRDRRERWTTRRWQRPQSPVAADRGAARHDEFPCQVREQRRRGELRGLRDRREGGDRHDDAA